MLPTSVIPWCCLYHKGETVTLADYRCSDSIYAPDADRLRRSFPSAHDDLDPGQTEYLKDIRRLRHPPPPMPVYDPPELRTPMGLKVTRPTPRDTSEEVLFPTRARRACALVKRLQREAQCAETRALASPVQPQW